MLRRAFLLLILTVSGCTYRCGHSGLTMGPDGGEAYIIKCAAHLMERCYCDAATACPQGYRIIDQTTATDSHPLGWRGVQIDSTATWMIQCGSDARR